MKQSQALRRIKPIKPVHQALRITWYAWIL